MKVKNVGATVLVSKILIAREIPSANCLWMSVVISGVSRYFFHWVQVHDQNDVDCTSGCIKLPEVYISDS